MARAFAPDRLFSAHLSGRRSMTNGNDLSWRVAVSTSFSVHRHKERDLVAIDGAPDLTVRLARGIQDAVEGERALALAAVGLLASALVVCLHDRHLRVDRVGREVAGGVAGDRDVVGEADGVEVDRGGG